MPADVVPPARAPQSTRRPTNADRDIAARPGPASLPRPACFDAADLCRIAACAMLLLIPAAWNGFPLVFPDSGTYLGIAAGTDYAVDRSSFYGLLLKPFLALAPGMAGLWLAVSAQAVAVAAILLGAAQWLIGDRRWALPACALLIPFTALPWHAGQLMPDAFTGPLVLLAILGALRPVGARGMALAWAAALGLALLHYTHLVLLPVVTVCVSAALMPFGLPWRAAIARGGMAIAVATVAAGLLAGANGLVLGRWTPSPAGPAFLFARLHEDGLIDGWLDRHCGRDAPAPLCAERSTIPRDSQALLWGPVGPVARHVWAGDEAERWRWIGMFATANRGAIADRPIAFLRRAITAAALQSVRFAALDDECPDRCGRDRRAGLGYILARDRPATLPALDASMQLRDATPKRLVRAVTGGMATAGLLLLPFAALAGWRRRDGPAVAAVAGVVVALTANAAMAGALSDVHDRYQSRIVWLAPMIVLLLALRWRRAACPVPPPGA